MHRAGSKSRYGWVTSVDPASDTPPGPACPGARALERGSEGGDEAEQGGACELGIRPLTNCNRTAYLTLRACSHAALCRSISEHRHGVPPHPSCKRLARNGSRQLVMACSLPLAARFSRLAASFFPPIRSPSRVLIHNIQPVAVQGAEQEAKQTHVVLSHPVPVCKRSDYQVFQYADFAQLATAAVASRSARARNLLLLVG